VLGLEPLQPRDGGDPNGTSVAGEDGSIPVLDAGVMLTALRGAMGAAGGNN
jgi:hypothetical protein